MIASSRIQTSIHDEIPDPILAENGIYTGAVHANRISRIINLVQTIKDAVFDEVQTLGKIGLIIRKHALFSRFVRAGCMVFEDETANRNVGHPTAGLVWFVCQRFAKARPETIRQYALLGF